MCFFRNTTSDTGTVLRHFITASSPPPCVQDNMDTGVCVHVVLCPLVTHSFGLSLLLLSVLISRRSPAHSILFAQGQDKHCLCVTPKTFHRLSRFQHGPDISIIVFFLLVGVLERARTERNESGRGERLSSGGGGGGRGKQKGQFSFPPRPH